MITSYPKYGHPRTVTHHDNDRHPPSKGWSATFPWIVSPMMVTHHLQHGHSPSQGWSPILHRMVSHDGQPAFPGLSPTIPKTVTHHPKHGNPLSTGLSPQSPFEPSLSQREVKFDSNVVQLVSECFTLQISKSVPKIKKSKIQSLDFLLNQLVLSK